MAPSKLSDADKQTILELYRQPEETTSTLADRYGVSNSTISRLLKSQLPEAEYAALIQQKRGGEKGSSPGPEDAALPWVEKPVEESVQLIEKLAEAAVETGEQAVVKASPAPPKPKVKVKSTPAPTPVAEAPDEEVAAPGVAPPRRRRAQGGQVEAETDSTQLPLLSNIPEEMPAPIGSSAYGLPPMGVAEVETDSLPVAQEDAIAAVIGESSPVEADYDEEEDDLDGEDDDLDDDYDDEEDYDDDDADLGNWKFSKEGTPQLQKVQISPLTAAALPRLCYVVVERTSAELVTCPLRDFAELGQIPEAEIDARTLPVFDNHRVARRFSRRNQRVVKVPDGTMLQKTSPYLQAKGITRLLIDGQIYTLDKDPSVRVSPPLEED